MRKYRSLSEAPSVLVWDFFICIKCLPSLLHLSFSSLVLRKEQHGVFGFVFFKYCLAALVNTVEDQHGVCLFLPSHVLGFFYSLLCYTIKMLIVSVHIGTLWLVSFNPCFCELELLAPLHSPRPLSLQVLVL